MSTEPAEDYRGHTQDHAGQTDGQTDGQTHGHPDYYSLVERNRGIVPAAAQDQLRRAQVLVAGCGSTGGAAVEPLVRIGIQRLLLADNGEFELNNLNRQNAGHDDIGRNKALVAAERARAINPCATTEIFTDGITDDNVDKLVAAAALVVDGVDVTTQAGWRAKYRLHEAAARLGRPVLTGWDMAGTQLVRYYGYHRDGAKALPMDGAVTAEQVAALSAWQLMARVVPLRHVPYEMLREALTNLGRPEYSVPQVVYASEVFGAVVAHAAVVILGGGTPRRETVVDLHRAVASPVDRWRRHGAGWSTRLAAVPTVIRLKRRSVAA